MEQNTILYIILGILLVGGLMATGLGLFTVFGEGFTVTSISTSRIISNQEDISDTWFLIDTVLDGGGQSIVGVINQNDFEQESGYETEYPLEISMSTVDETLDINIQNLNEPLYKYSMITVDRPNLFTAPECPGGTEYEIEYYSWTGTLTHMICVDKVQVATKGRLSDAQVGFNADIGLEVGDDEIIKTISNRDSSVSFYDGNTLRATAQWTGNLMTGDQLPEYGDIVPVYWTDSAYNTRWKLLYNDHINQYDNYLATTTSALRNWENNQVSVDNWEQAVENVDAEIDTLNNYVDYTMKRTDVQITHQTEISNQYSSDDASVRLSLDRRFSNPNILFKVKADWVGVKIPVGEPQITGLNCDEWNSGEIGVIDVEIRNVGDTTSTFLIEIKNCDPIESRYGTGTNRVTIEEGDTKTVPVQLSTGGYAQDLTRICTVRVYDYNYPENEDQDDVRCEMEEATACEEGRVWVDGDCIKECKDNEIVTVECCDHGVIYENGEYKCDESPTGKDEICDNLEDDDGDGLIDMEDPDCQEKSCTELCDQEFSGFLSSLNPMKQVCYFRCFIQETLTILLMWFGIMVGIVVVFIMGIVLIREVRK